MVLKCLLTGGSCSGKTAVINELKNKGFLVVEEAAMIMIKESLKTGKGLLPWIDSSGFESSILTKRIELENLIDLNVKYVFIDRGIPDGIAYAKFNNRKPTKEYIEASKKYKYDYVFFLDLLPNYSLDDRKKESPEMREKLHFLIEETYSELGYELIKIPVMSVEKRVNLILKYVENT